MVRWGMTVDLRSCAGCQTCTIACKLDNGTAPRVLWRRVRDVEVGKYPSVRRFFLPTQCMQCANPPCMEVCPTTATKRRSDGIVYIDYAKCLGCGYCILACPFDARWLVREEDGYFAEASPAGMNNRLAGVCTKCDFCSDRVDYGIKEGLRVGTDPDATPVCANSCPANAIKFGDLDDPASELAEIIKTRNSFQLRPEMKTNPSVYYVW